MKRNHYDDTSIIQALRASGTVPLSDETKKRLMRAILLSYQTDDGRPQTEDRDNKRSSFFSLHPMIPTIILVVLLALGTGTALAADRAKPGDALFGIDQALERTRLSFTLSAETKAQVAADIAEERQEEQQELEKENRLAALDEANRHVDKALEQATETLEKVRDNVDAKDATDRASDALLKVEEKLTNLQVRHQETIAKAVTVLTEAEVKLYPTYAFVKIELKDKKSSFRLETVDRNAIIREIAKRTGVAESAIRSVVKFETVDDEVKNTNTTPEEQENENVNQENKNENTNEQDDDTVNDDKNVNSSTVNQRAVQWNIEVRVRGQVAAVRAEKGGEKREWTVPTANQNAILASVAARTGLTTAEITRIWDLKAED